MPTANTTINTIEGNCLIATRDSSRSLRIGIVAARFNETIVASLIQGAVDGLIRQGFLASQIDIIRVPGAYELPWACQQLAKQGAHAGLIALGAVIRGSTPHFDYVCASCASGIQQVILSTNVPIAFGVLTTDTVEQAMDRSGLKAGNKGLDAAMGLLEIIDLGRQLVG